MSDWPKIKSRRTTKVSPWMEIIEREVEFAPGAPTELYHAVGQQDYIAIVALTPDGKIPIVRQYRPALERFTWELPAGLVDKGEAAADTCRRELLEETGYPATRRACARRLCALHRAAVEPDAFILCRDRRAPPKHRHRGGHRAQAGDAGGTGRADPVRRIRPAASYRRHSARRPAGYLDLGALQAPGKNHACQRASLRAKSRRAGF